MTQPEIPQRAPYVMDCQPGKYAWCSCGKSANQPFCDGAHADTGMTPVIEEITEARKVAWCGFYFPLYEGLLARLVLS